MFKVYGKKGCKYCALLKQDLTAIGVPFEYFDIETNPSKRKEYPSDWQTVPAVMYGNHFIGGYEDLVKYLSP